MKTILFLFTFIFCASTSIAQTPDYFANQPSWYVDVAGGSPFTSIYYYSYLLYLGGDTTVSGKTYHKVYRRGYDTNNNTQPPSPSNYFNDLHILLRQEGKSIRYFDSQNQTDSLMIDYNLTVGDTAKGCVFSNMSPYQRIVERIDSVLIGGEYRNRFFLDTAQWGLAFIEGVAEASGCIECSPPTNIGASVFKPYEELQIEHIPNVCYGQYNSALWSSDGGCNLAVGIESMEKKSPEIIYDTGNKTIKIESEEVPDELLLYNMLGQVEAKSKSSIISCEGLKDGVYMVVVKINTGIFIERVFVY